jgi:hypothetical protein
MVSTFHLVSTEPGEAQFSSLDTYAHDARARQGPYRQSVQAQQNRCTDIIKIGLAGYLPRHWQRLLAA